jgi:nitrogen fixation NifU-like protein
MNVMYSAELLDHFERPRNAGEVADANAQVEISNPVCGDVVRLTARIVEGRVAAIGFRAKGCVPAIACASALTELALGREIHALRELARDDVERKVGGLPEASGHASALAIDALRALLGSFR